MSSQFNPVLVKALLEYGTPLMWTLDTLRELRGKIYMLSTLIRLLRGGVDQAGGRRKGV
jgi:hypothetical protein